MPRTGVQHPSAHETDKEWREKWKFRGEVVAVVLLIAGAIVGFRTLGELQRQSATLERQTATLQQQIYAGERAYLLVKNVRIQTSGTLVAGSQLRLQWDTVNVGQTPAQNIRTQYAIYFGPRGLDVIPPSGSEHIYSEGRALGPGETEESPDVFGVWLEGEPGRALTVEDLDRLNSGEFLNARITVAYDTVFGVPGRTTVCAYYEGSRFSYCGLRGTQIE